MLSPLDEPSPSPPRPGKAAYAPEQLDKIIAAALDDLRASGDPVGKIAMIRLLRERSGLGLKEAKDAVESYGRRSGLQELVASEATGVGCLIVATAVLILGAGAFALFRALSR